MNKKKKTKGSIWDGWGAKQVRHRFGKPKDFHVYQMKVTNPGDEQSLFALPFTIPLFPTWEECDQRAGAISIDIVAYWQRHANEEEHPQQAAQRIIEALGKDALGTLEQLNNEIQNEAEFVVYRPDGTKQGKGLIFKVPLSDAQIKALLRQRPGWTAEIARERHKLAVG